MSENNYAAHTCPQCGQTTTYLLPIDKGTIDIVLGIAQSVKNKGINCVYPRKEMEGVVLTSNQVGNLSRPRFHGLIAKVEGQKGNYCLTHKGINFLKGKSIPKYAIIRHITGN